MAILTALIAGLIFGCGLLLSGMANPAKVLGFLDIAGDFDPSLALVMVGAITTAFIPFALAKKMRQSLLGEKMQLPVATEINKRLVIGSATFGIGWGIAGFCPGPSLVALSMGEIKAAVFVLSMLLGMLAFGWLQKITAR